MGHDITADEAAAFMWSLQNLWFTHVFELASKDKLTQQDQEWLNGTLLHLYVAAKRAAPTEGDELALDELEFSPRRMGMTAMHVAAISGNVDMVERLSGYVSFDAKDFSGRSVQEVATGPARDYIDRQVKYGTALQKGMKAIRAAQSDDERVEISRQFYAEAFGAPSVG